ncbi:LysR family transcriptional regulator [Shewanella psychropiezotolerans]|uniref:LysR family transcriptional regulator n=2 Tax=Shewanellaceae TaxID=267890 RepID=A0ABX5WX56_9GAMM|nr:LysR family transcriptional regulator [Shewanella sp. YLB-07]QDO83663.1 LysR family transcriptional regulator [Shewanella psychropiezotolerans]
MNNMNQSFDELTHLDLNYLPMLAVLLKEMHVTNAAKKLKVSQPAMSQMLKKFRHLFNDPILVKTKDGMILTNKAQEIKQSLEPIFALMVDTIENRRFSPLTAQGSVRLVMDDVSARLCTVKIIEHLKVLAPKLNLQINLLDHNSFQKLRGGQVDFVISCYDRVPYALNHKVISYITYQDVSMGHVSQDKELKRLVYTHLGCEKSSVVADKSLDELIVLRSCLLGSVMNALSAPNTVAWLPYYAAKVLDGECRTALQWKGHAEQHALKLFWNDYSEHAEVNKWLRNELALLLPTILCD